MPHYSYIIFSKKLNRFYAGESKNPEIRLNQHNSGHFKYSSTKSANDWVLFLTIECTNRTQAIKIERFIKKMRNRNFYERLKNEPKTITDLLIRFSE